MKFGQGRVFLGAYAAILAAGIAVAALVYVNGQSVLESSIPLVRRDLPLLKSIFDTKAAIVMQEKILYEYYASTDRAAFLEKYRLNHERIQRGLKEIRAGLDGSYGVRDVEADYHRVMEVARELDGTLRKIEVNNVDWDLARAQLVQVSDHAKRLNAGLDALADSVQREVFSDGQNTESKTRLVVNVVLVFTVIIVVIAVFVGGFVNAFLADVYERRRLALFADKNPNPVLRLSLDGQVGWANPATAEMLAKIGAESSAPGRLLPADLDERLGAMQMSETAYERWEYEIANIAIGCSIHFLPKYGMFYAYLSDITEGKRAEQKLSYLAFHDELTGLPNRRMFRHDVGEAIARAAEGEGVAVFLLNLDRFNLVIGSLGHTVGEDLLQLVAGRLASALSECKTDCAGAQLYRFEGATFSILARGFASSAAAMALAEKLAAYLAEAFHAGEHELFVTPSIGIGVFPADGRDVVSLLKNTDTALEDAKRGGAGGCRRYHPQMNAKALDRLSLESDLRRALEHDELLLHYQPQVDIASGRIVGMEALLRWQSPKRGLVSPAEFIPLAEDTGLIVPIGEWVLRTACAQFRDWQIQGLPAGTVAVNISARQFQAKGFTQSVEKILRDTGLRSGHLELEITESVVMESAETAVATLGHLKDLGVKLSIDDFGTAYSSMNYLKRFPLDKLKVDQSFVRNLTSNANDGAITQAVVNLGHGLGLRVIAEGVETAEHLAILRGYGCDEIQGYLFSRPVPAEALAEILRVDKRLPGRPETRGGKDTLAAVA